MSKVAVIYHSGYGHTKVIAESVLEGAKEAGAEAVIYDVDSLSEDLAELADVDAMIFGSPTYMGSVSAPFKAFMDKASKVWFVRGWVDKIAAGFTVSNSFSGDKFNTLMQIFTFASQQGMIWVGQTEMNTSNPPGNPEALNRMGSFTGLMAQAGNEDPSVSPPKGDHDTARLFGKRIADVSARFSK